MEIKIVGKLNNIIKFLTAALWLTILTACITGCGQKSGDKGPVRGDEYYYNPSKPTETTKADVRYNKTDMAVVTEINHDEKYISVQSVKTGEPYRLIYTGGTDILSKTGGDLTMAQISTGDIADVYYIDGTQKLIRLQISPDAWENTLATGLVVSPEKMAISFAGTNYRYDDKLVVISGTLQVNASSIDAVDEVTVRGTGSEIRSIIISKGHGYIKLEDLDKFEGGVIEIGSRITKIIRDKLVITAPEGTYDISVSNNGIGGKDTITVNRNETLTLSLLKYRGEIDREGLLKLNVNPKEAKVMIDGKAVDYGEAFAISYGTHKIRASAEGYADYAQEIVIDSVYRTYNIDMEKLSPETGTTQKETGTRVDSKAKIYITTPEGAKVFFDGIYKGIAPVNFEKVTGDHIIIITGEGFDTKTYSVSIPDDGEDFIKSYGNSN